MRPLTPSTLLVLFGLALGCGPQPAHLVADEPKAKADAKAPPDTKGAIRVTPDDLTKALAQLEAEAKGSPDLRKYFRASVQLHGALGDLRDQLASRADLAALSGTSTGSATIKPKEQKQGAAPPIPPPDNDKRQGPPNPGVDWAELAKRRTFQDWLEFDPLARQAERRLLALDRSVVEAQSNDDVKKALAEVEQAVKSLTKEMESKRLSNPPR